MTRQPVLKVPLRVLLANFVHSIEAEEYIDQQVLKTSENTITLYKKRYISLVIVTITRISVIVMIFSFLEKYVPLVPFTLLWT
jgi:hypothetical protein